MTPISTCLLAGHLALHARLFIRLNLRLLTYLNSGCIFGTLSWARTSLVRFFVDVFYDKFYNKSTTSRSSRVRAKFGVCDKVPEECIFISLEYLIPSEFRIAWINQVLSLQLRHDNFMINDQHHHQNSSSLCRKPARPFIRMIQHWLLATNSRHRAAYTALRICVAHALRGKNRTDAARRKSNLYSR